MLESLSEHLHENWRFWIPRSSSAAASRPASGWLAATRISRRAFARIGPASGPVSGSSTRPRSLAPPVTRSRISPQLPARTSTRTAGQRARRAANRDGSTYAPIDSTDEITSVALTRVDASASAPTSSVLSANMRRAYSSRTSPDLVRAGAPLPALRNSSTPSVRSSELSVSETVDCEMPSARAARVWVPPSTTAAKTRRCRSSNSVFTAQPYHRPRRWPASAFW